MHKTAEILPINVPVFSQDHLGWAVRKMQRGCGCHILTSAVPLSLQTPIPSWASHSSHTASEWGFSVLLLLHFQEVLRTCAQPKPFSSQALWLQQQNNPQTNQSEKKLTPNPQRADVPLGLPLLQPALQLIASTWVGACRRPNCLLLCSIPRPEGLSSPVLWLWCLKSITDFILDKECGSCSWLWKCVLEKFRKLTIVNAGLCHQAGTSSWILQLWKQHTWNLRAEGKLLSCSS